MSFITELNIRDLKRLGLIVRNTQLKYYPNGYLTNKEVDKFIDAMGPLIAEKMIKMGIDSGKVD